MKYNMPTKEITRLTMEYGDSTTTWLNPNLDVDISEMMNGVATLFIGAGMLPEEIYEAMYNYGRDHLPVDYFDDYTDVCMAPDKIILS